jgi:hypothetical protein
MYPEESNNSAEITAETIAVICCLFSEIDFLGVMSSSGISVVAQSTPSPSFMLTQLHGEWLVDFKPSEYWTHTQ